MRARLLSDSSEKVFIVVFETGDEVMQGLLEFALDNRVGAAHFTAIGALSSVVLGYLDWEKKDHEQIPLREQVEVLSLVGDVALEDGKPKIHAHIVVGKRDGTAHGGHLLEGRVRPTLEVVLHESPEHLARKPDAETGLALIDLDDTP